MAKNKQQIKFEADISGFKANIKEAEKSITNLNNQLKLNQSQLKGNTDDSNLLSQRIETLKKKYDEQTKVVENTRKAYEEAVKVFGENSKEAENLKNKLLQAETAQQNIKNEIDKTNQQLIAQTNNLAKTGKAWQESGERLKDYGSKIESVGKKLSILSGLVGGIAIASLKSSIDFESAFTGVTKTVDATEEELAELRQGILDLSTEIPTSATEIAAVAEAAGQLGIKTENILSFSKAMIDLGNSTNLTSEEAASQLAKFANIMQMSQEDFDKLGSAIVDLGNNFATTEADIVDMAMRLAGAGKQVGLTEGEVLGLATALSSVGIEAEMGGSAISKAMVKMQNAVELGGGKLNTVLSKTGKSLRDLELLSANNSKDFKDLCDSIGMTSTEVKQLITAGTNLEDFANISGMTAEQFKKAWQEDAVGALTAFINGLGDAENKGESAITMLSEMGLTEVRLRDSLLRAANAGDLLNTAVETGTKAFKENTALANEANKRYATTESQLKMLKNEATKTAIEFGDELAPSLRQLVKDSKPLLKNIASAVKSFAELDSKTKKNIISIGALVVALGPAVKIGGTFIKTLGSVKTAVGTLTGAIGVLKNGTDGANENSIKFAKTLQGLTSTTGLLTIGVLGISSAVVYLATKESETEKQHRLFAEQMLDSKKSLEEYNKSIDEVTNSNLSQINSTSRLKDELITLADENGKVKDEYKSRVEFILKELNEALGTEYKLNGNIIQNYKDLQEEIDKTIEKKKAEIVLNAHEEKYKNAIENQEEAVKKLKEAHDNLGMSIEEAKKKRQELIDEHDKYAEGNGGTYWESKELKELNNLISAYENAEWVVKDYTDKINTYTGEYEKYVEGKYSEIGNIITTSTEDWSKKSLDEVKKSIEEQSKNLETYKLIYKETGNDIAKQLKQQSQENLNTLAKELAERTSTVNELSEEEIDAWKSMASKSYEAYNYGISQLPSTLRSKVEEMTAVIARQTPQFKQEAINNLKGYLQGLSDEELRNFLKEAGVKDVEIVMQGIKEGNLGEEEGIDILTSLYKGLSNNSWQGSIYQTAKGIATKLSDLLNVKATVEGSNLSLGAIVSKLPGHKNGLDYVPYDNYVARLHKGERVLTAEENEQYMSNLQNKVATRNITVQIYPQTMTEAELQRAEKYISRKWGLVL